MEVCACVVQFQPVKSGSEQALEGGTLSQVTEKYLVAVTFAPARQAQRQIFRGQNGKEMVAFPISARQWSHKSQEVQRGSGIRRYFRH